MCGVRGRAGSRPISTHLCCAARAFRPATTGRRCSRPTIASPCRVEVHGSFPSRPRRVFEPKAAAVSEGQKIKQCPSCKGSFAIGPNTRRRLHAVYCSARCRMAVGPLPGELMVAYGALFYGALVALGVITFLLDRTKHKDRDAPVAMG